MENFLVNKKGELVLTLDIPKVKFRYTGKSKEITFIINADFAGNIFERIDSTWLRSGDIGVLKMNLKGELVVQFENILSRSEKILKCKIELQKIIPNDHCILSLNENGIGNVPLPIILKDIERCDY